MATENSIINVGTDRAAQSTAAPPLTGIVGLGF
jgi:hypothetical protein